MISRIKELEDENKQLKKELEYYKEVNHLLVEDKRSLVENYEIQYNQKGKLELQVEAAKTIATNACEGQKCEKCDIEDEHDIECSLRKLREVLRETK